MINKSYWTEVTFECNLEIYCTLTSDIWDEGAI